MVKYYSRRIYKRSCFNVLDVINRDIRVHVWHLYYHDSENFFDHVYNNDSISSWIVDFCNLWVNSKNFFRNVSVSNNTRVHLNHVHYLDYQVDLRSVVVNPYDSNFFVKCLIIYFLYQNVNHKHYQRSVISSILIMVCRSNVLSYIYVVEIVYYVNWQYRVSTKYVSNIVCSVEPMSYVLNHLKYIWVVVCLFLLNIVDFLRNSLINVCQSNVVSYIWSSLSDVTYFLPCICQVWYDNFHNVQDCRLRNHSTEYSFLSQQVIVVYRCLLS